MKNNRAEFYHSLVKALSMPLLTVIGVTALYVVLMSVIDHKSFPFDYIIVTLAILKTYLIALVTFNHLSKLVKKCFSLERLVLVFGVIILVTILSFAIDYSCLYEYRQSTFSGIEDYSDSYISKIPNFFYFSVTTFATVGYGDITPSSGIAKILVLLEIFLSFLIIVFALSNINKIQIHER